MDVCPVLCALCCGAPRCGCTIEWAVLGVLPCCVGGAAPATHVVSECLATQLLCSIVWNVLCVHMHLGPCQVHKRRCRSPGAHAEHLHEPPPAERLAQ
jgi:hypothetical protein